MLFRSRDELESFRGASVPDLVGPSTRVLFVGINPGLWTAATQTHFCHPSNRFYPALRRASLIDWEVDASVGMTDMQRADFTEKGFGITNIVNRATGRASELSTLELRKGASRLSGLISRVGPAVVAVAGVTAFRIAFGDPKAGLGPQRAAIGGAVVWVVPNPSG